MYGILGLLGENVTIGRLRTPSASVGRSAPTLQPTCRPSRPKKKGGRVSPPPLFGTTTHRTCRSCAFRALAAYPPLGRAIPPFGVSITLRLSVARPAAFIGSGSVGITRILPNNNTIPHSEPLVKYYAILHRHLTTSDKCGILSEPKRRIARSVGTDT